MSFLALIGRSLRHYWNWHLALLLGVAVAGTVIVGSLIVGDSVKASLRRQAELRLGKVDLAITSGEGFFTRELARKAQAELRDAAVLAPLLVLRGTVSAQGGEKRANGVSLIGVTPDFWKLAAQADTLPNGAEWLAGNSALANQLGMKPGEPLVVRFEKPSLISRDAPLSGESDQTTVLNGDLAAVVSDASLGAFSLKLEQTPALNLFLPLEQLQAAAGLDGRANFLLVRQLMEGANLPTKTLAALEKHRTLADVGLELAEVQQGTAWRLATNRVFIDPAAANALAADASGVLTYLCIEAKGAGEHYTAYPIVSALDARLGLLPRELSADQVVINQWTADELKLKPGDPLTLRYFVVTRARQLREESAKFVVHSVVPMEHPSVQAEWTPNFPGLMDKIDCREWKPGIPIEKGFIRPADVEYWKPENHKGQPKVVLGLGKAQELWRNRFGDLTGLILAKEKFPTAAAVEAKVKSALTLGAAGFVSMEPQKIAQAAVGQSLDFGQLFLAMSFFLIATALILAALLFLFNVEARAGQLGLLRAIGMTAEKARLVFLGEAALVALLGSLLGLAGGLVYTDFTLGRLGGEWSAAVGRLDFVREVRPMTLFHGAFGTFSLAVLVVYFFSRRLVQAAPGPLLAGNPLTKPMRAKRLTRRHGLSFWIAFACLIIAAGMAPAAAKLPRHFQPGVFFGAALLVLLGGSLLFADWLRGLDLKSTQTGIASPWALGLRNMVRRRGRSLAVAALLSAGIFMVVALNTFHHDARKIESPGTGGFDFLGTSDLPIYEDLNAKAGREAYALEESEMGNSVVLGMRVREGEEASCLNLNRAQAPTVLGVDAAKMAEHAKFKFGLAKSGLGTFKSQWDMLTLTFPDGAIPAIMDQDSAMWALGKKLGDVVTVADSKGQPAHLRLVAFVSGSVLQGHVVIAEPQFEKLYPDTGGYRFFLAKGPTENKEAWREMLTARLQNRGLALVPASERLAQLLAVKNTYLGIFSLLGGLGLLLSTAGLGLLIARNVLQRRGEFGLLQAAGFQGRDLRAILLGEHTPLFGVALLLGIAAATMAVWPHLRDGGHSLPLPWLAFLLTGLALGGLLFCFLAAWLALRKPLMNSIRHE